MFDGVCYDSENDFIRLCTQHDRVKILMSDAKWRTLGEIEEITAAPQASISAILRDFRKKRFGGHTVDKRIKGDKTWGLYEYKLVDSDGMLFGNYKTKQDLFDLFNEKRHFKLYRRFRRLHGKWIHTKTKTSHKKPQPTKFKKSYKKVIS